MTKETKETKETKVEEKVEAKVEETKKTEIKKSYNLIAEKGESKINVDGIEKRSEALNTGKTLIKAGYKVEILEVKESRRIVEVK